MRHAQRGTPRMRVVADPPVGDLPHSSTAPDG